MLHMLPTYVKLFFIAVLFTACKHKEAPIPQGKVFVKKVNNKYSLIKNGKVFAIKGASGYTNLKQLSLMGGNAIRTWDTAHLASILAEAKKYGISVIVGLPIPQSQYLSFYNDTSRVASEVKKIEKFIKKFKSDPSVLMWCVGNELVFPFKPAYKNFYKTFNDIVKIIHQQDPDHPVTTTMVNFQKKDIINIKLRTDVDIISFNIFSRLAELSTDLANFEWFWDGPYMITEWGIDGPWQGFAQTAWEANLEPTSTQKAKDYFNRYRKYMPVNDPRFIGSFIFFWGQKQEITHTWFSLFDENGNSTECVKTAGQIFTGKAANYDGPRIADLLLGGKKGNQNIILKPGELQSAKVFMPDTTKAATVKWEIYPEDWFKKNNVDNLVKPKLLNNLIAAQNGLTVSFKTPKKEGPYRIFATVFDGKKNIATANVPFYVISPNEEN